MAQTTSATWNTIMSGEHWFECKLSIFSDNLFDASDVSASGYYVDSTTGNNTSTAGYRASGYIPVKPWTVYYIGAEHNNASTAGIAFYDSSKTYISGVSETVTKAMHSMVTSPHGAAFLRITIVESLNPSYATTAFVSEYGRNLFDSTDVTETGRYIKVDGTEAGGSTGYRATGYIEVEPGVLYYWGARSQTSSSAGMAFYDSDKVCITGYTLAQWNGAGRMLVSPPGARFMRSTIGVGTNADWQYSWSICAGTHNLIDANAVPEENKYVTSGYGTLSAPSNPNTNHWRHSDYIPVNGGEEYKFGHLNATASSAGIAWYKANKTYISGTNDTNLGTANNLVTAPSNATWVRLSWSIDSDYNPDWENTVFFISTATPVYHQYRLDFDETKIHSLSTANGFFGDNPTIGGCGCGEMSFTIAYNSENIVKMAKCIPYVRCKNDTPSTSEWIQKGEYFIDERSMTKYQGGYQTLTAHCYDAMLKAEAMFPSSTLAFPASDIDLVSAISTELGIALDSRTSTLLSKGYQISLPASYSMREILSYIGAMYGANTIISDAGKLLMVPLTGGSDSHSLGQGTKKLDYGLVQKPYTKVTYIVSETGQVSSGSGDANVLEVDNPLGTTAIATACLSSLSTFSYQPYTADSCIIDPAFELGDSVTIDGVTSYIYSASTEFGRLMLATLSAPLTVDVDHEYQYSSPTERKYRRELGNMSSQITLNSEQIQLKVNSGDIISTINQSAEAVTIDADKINLNGNVSVGTSDSQAMITLDGPDSTTTLYPYGMQVKNKASASSPNLSTLFQGAATYWKRANGVTGLAISAGGIFLYDSNHKLRARLNFGGLEFLDANGNQLNNYPAVTATSPYWKITDTVAWRVRNDSTGDGTFLGWAYPNDVFPYLGEDNGWININYNGNTNAWVAAGSGTIIYQ